MPDPENESQSSDAGLPGNWHLTIRKLHRWRSEQDGKASPPYVMMLSVPEQKEILRTRIVAEKPTPPAVLDWIRQSIQSLERAQAAPGSIVSDDAPLVEALTDLLPGGEIRFEYQALPEGVDEAIALFEELVDETLPDFPGLLTVEGLTPELARKLFSDAEQFFLTYPWEALSDRQPIAVQVEPPGQELFIQVLGQAGIQRGLNLFFDWKALSQMSGEVVDPFEGLPSSGIHSFSFEPSNLLPVSDLRAIEEHHLPIASAQGYPLPLIYKRDDISRPALAELAIFDALLQALPGFVKGLQVNGGGGYLPHQSEFYAQTLLGPRVLRLRFPARMIPEGKGAFLGHFQEPAEQAEKIKPSTRH